jgi:hypothetical protein
MYIIHAGSSAIPDAAAAQLLDGENPLLHLPRDILVNHVLHASRLDATSKAALRSAGR